VIYRILGGVGLLVLALVSIWLYGNAREHTGALKERAKWEAARADTIAQQQAAARAREAAQAAIQDKASHDTQARIDALRGAVAVWMRNAQATRPSVNLPSTSEAAADIARSGSNAVVPATDLTICADNTARLTGWQQWYNEVSK